LYLRFQDTSDESGDDEGGGDIKQGYNELEKVEARVQFYT